MPTEMVRSDAIESQRCAHPQNWANKIPKSTDTCRALAPTKMSRWLRAAVYMIRVRHPADGTVPSTIDACLVAATVENSSIRQFSVDRPIAFHFSFVSFSNEWMFRWMPFCWDCLLFENVNMSDLHIFGCFSPFSPLFSFTLCVGFTSSGVNRPAILCTHPRDDAYSDKSQPWVYFGGRRIAVSRWLPVISNSSDAEPDFFRWPTAHTLVSKYKTPLSISKMRRFSNLICFLFRPH